MSTIEQSTDSPAWYAQDAAAALTSLSVDPDQGLDAGEAQRRLAEYGPNELATEPPPSVWAVALGQLSNPMNIMLVIVAVASLAIGQVATGIFVALLVTFNVVMGSSQELKARASVDALAQLQVPQARVRRAGRVEEVDVGRPRAGRHRAARGRRRRAGRRPDRRRRRRSRCRRRRSRARARRSPRTPRRSPRATSRSATARTWCSRTPRSREARRAFVVTATGQATQMGHIADMVTATKRVRSPLQRELDGMTKIFGLLAWTAVAIIAIVGIARGQDTETLILLCISTAISAIPVGLPTFVQTMLSSGARHLAEDKAVVKSLTDVETLGGTTVINSDKTGTLTMNAMTATTMLADGEWFQIEGGGYTKTGAILGVGGRAGARLLASRRSASCSPATRPSATTSRSSATRPKRRSWCSPRRWASAPRRPAPRCRGCAEVPFDSEYKFMATFHDRPDWITRRRPARRRTS